ncbi:MAG: hypothetical protein ACRENI_06240 [Gemmatimonadaceae bacterium]
MRSPRNRRIDVTFLGALIWLAAVPLSTLVAQQADTVSFPTHDLSGVLYTHFRYGGGRDSRSANRFDVERAYFTLRARLSERLALRLTTDVFQQDDDDRDDYYSGWTIRAKYAYLQYDLLARSPNRNAFAADVRLGMLNTVIIGHEDDYWPRWIAKTPLDRLGFFASADLGLASTARFGRVAEAYATVTNGTGYTSREKDRFKDVGLRLTLTPFAASDGWLGTLSVTPWGYKGARASDFSEGDGTIEPVAGALRRDRYGVFAGIDAARITAGAEIAHSVDVVEIADPLVDIRPVNDEDTGRLLWAFAHVRPFARANGTPVPLGVLLRYDRFQPDVDRDEYSNFIVAGLTWEIGSNLSLSLDYQEESGSAVASGAPDTRTWYLHAAASF